MNVLQFKNVIKKYDAHQTALKQISFSVEEGEFLALAGPSGSGKTTILNLACGMDHPSSGEVELLGASLPKMSESAILALRRLRVGFVFQAYHLFPVLTALENVAFPLALRGVSERERIQRARRALAEVGLERLAGNRPKELSGGQQQRVAVARAIVTQPNVVFADEPTANLDTQNSRSLLTLFKQLNREKEITFIFSSHDPLVLDAADRVIHLIDGEIEEHANEAVELTRSTRHLG